jgi:23S rRNA (guanosine2251-2'-O)-methyltransferase
MSGRWCVSRRFGVREVLVPEHRQALLANASVNTAQGGFALCDLVVVVNLGRALEELKELGYWIIGADMGGESVDVIRTANYGKIVLVMGSAESGLAAGIRYQVRPDGQHCRPARRT